jgi:hypothetical protein
VLKINIKLEIKSTVAVQQSSLGQIKSKVEKNKTKTNFGLSRLERNHSRR